MTAPAETPQVPFVLFCGPAGDGPTERLVDDARWAVGLDLLALAAQAGAFAPLLLATPAAGDSVPSQTLGLSPLPAGVRLVPTPDPPAFHLGRALWRIVCAEGFARVLIAGAGAGPLLRTEDLLSLARPLQGDAPAVVANNLHSADLVGVTPTMALDRIELPAQDNGLALLLWKRAGLPGHEPPRTAATQFDLDSPTDLLIAALHPATGPRLRRYLAGVELDRSRLRAAARVLRDPLGQIVVAGRVGSATWAYLERETACRVRLFAEERGMRALGLEGQARSLLGMHLEAVGPVAFMEHLAQLGQAAFLDTRVLLAHQRSTASREDRFLSDLGQWEGVQDPFLRELTRATVEAPIPVVLGGQNVVSGGLMALVEAAWAEVDTPWALP